MASVMATESDVFGSGVEGINVFVDIENMNAGSALGGGVCRLVQPPASPQRHQIRDAPTTPLRPSRWNLPTPRPCLRAGPSTASPSMEPIHPLLAQPDLVWINKPTEEGTPAKKLPLIQAT